MKVSSKAAEQAARIPAREFAERSLLNVAFQVGQEARKAEVAAEIRRGRELWAIALELGCSPQLVYALGGPKI